MSTTYDFAIRRVVRVLDGDTFDLEVDLGFRQYGVYRFRLLGLNTPEIFGVGHDTEEYQQGVEAQIFVTQWLSGRSGNLRVRSHKTGSFGRWLAEIYDGSTREELGQALLDAGLAEEANY